MPVVSETRLLHDGYPAILEKSATVSVAARLATLGVPALRFAADPAAAGDDAIAAGYPLDGPYTLSPARVAT